MADSIDILLRLPVEVLSEIDKVVRERQCSRSQCIQEAIRMYLISRQRETLRQQLIQGYQSMAALNLILAEECADEDCLSFYGCYQAEAE